MKCGFRGNAGIKVFPLPRLLATPQRRRSLLTSPRDEFPSVLCTEMSLLLVAPVHGTGTH